MIIKIDERSHQVLLSKRLNKARELFGQAQALGVERGRSKVAIKLYKFLHLGLEEGRHIELLSTSYFDWQIIVF